MTRFLALAFILLPTAIVPVTAETAPEASISNGVIHARLYLPDSEHGYYRGSRFDWSGVIASLIYSGHEYFGQWFEHYDPRLHDAITGPVEEFRSQDGALGFSEAKPGGMFLKIGVGVLRKPDDREYSFGRAYEIVNPGRRIVRPEADRVEFVHELTDGEGYAYVYRKTVRLLKNQLILDHTLKNTGRKTIETSVYDHDFYVMDGQRTGPDFTLRFAFVPKATQDLKGLAELRDHELIYLQELQKGQSAATYLTGFGDKASDNDIRVENRKTGAAVREMGDHPLSKMYLWSIPTTVCPEAYIDLKIAPGKQEKWRITYEFYTTGK